MQEAEATTGLFWPGPIGYGWQQRNRVWNLVDLLGRAAQRNRSLPHKLGRNDERAAAREQRLQAFGVTAELEPAPDVAAVQIGRQRDFKRHRPRQQPDAAGSETCQHDFGSFYSSVRDDSPVFKQL